VYGNWVRGGQHATKGAEEEEEAKKVGTKRTSPRRWQIQCRRRYEAMTKPPPRVLSEVHVKTTERDMTGKVDILVQDRDESPVLMIEAGLLNDDWWRKLDQGLMYVPGLKMFTKPFLFVVLTMDVNRDDPE
jgi:hypothetical protein